MVRVVLPSQQTMVLFQVEIQINQPECKREGARGGERWREREREGERGGKRREKWREGESGGDIAYGKDREHRSTL